MSYLSVLREGLPTLLATESLSTKSWGWKSSLLPSLLWMRTKPCIIASKVCLVWSPCFQLHLSSLISWILSSNQSGHPQKSHGHQACLDTLSLLEPSNSYLPCRPWLNGQPFSCSSCPTLPLSIVYDFKAPLLCLSWYHIQFMWFLIIRKPEIRSL